MANYQQYPSDPEATSPYYNPNLLAKWVPPISLNQKGPNPNAVKMPGAKAPGALAGANWAGAATGAIGLASSAMGLANKRFNFGNVQQSQTDSNSAPTYTNGQLYNEVSGAKPQGASGGDILNAAGQGAAIGSSILPGIGTVIGAAGGALISGLSGLFGKNQQDTEKNRKMAELRTAQGQFNKQDEDYRTHQNQLYNYYNQNNAEGREYNVYKSRFNS